MTHTEDDPFYTPMELAGKLRVHYRTIYDWLHEGKLPFIKPSCKKNGSYLIIKEKLRADLKARIAHFDVPKMAENARSEWLERKPRPKKRK